MRLNDLPFDAPTDEGTHRRMPGQCRIGMNKPIDAMVFGLYPKQPAPEGAPRRLEDIPEPFRKPAKPPVRR